VSESFCASDTINSNSMLKTIIVLCFIALSYDSYSQIDSLDQDVLIQEVTVQGKGLKDNGLEIKQDDDVQILIDKLLYNINGVSLIKRGNYAQEPIIRGLNPSQINTTVDGMQIFGACTDHMDPISSYVEPNNLSSIRLNLGPNADQVGASIGGGFDFKLNKAKLGADKFVSGTVGTGYETNASAYRVLGSVQLSKKRWAVKANSIYRKSQNYTDGNQREIHFSQYEKLNFGVSSVFALNENNFIYLDYLQDDGRDIGYPALTMDVSFANAKIGSVSHLYKRTGKTLYRLESKIYYNFIDHAMDDTKRPDSLISMHMDMPGTSWTGGFYSNASLRFGEKHFVKIKLNGYSNDLHAEMTMYPTVGAEMFMLTIPDSRRTVFGIDLSDKILLTDKLKLSAGFRFDYAASSITTEEGRQTLSSIYTGELDRTHYLFNVFTQLNYKLTKKLSVSGGVAKAMRAPNAQELYGFFLFNRFDNYDYMGNPDIKQEESWNFNISTRYRLEKLVFTAKVFAYYFKNYIAGEKLSGYSAMTAGASGVKQYTNLDNAIITGAEVGFKWRINKKLFFSSMNAFSYGEDHKHRALFMIPPLKSINTIVYSIKGYNVSLKYTTAMAQNHIDYDFYGENSTREFNLFDLSAGKTFKVKRFKYDVNIALDNIFNVPYYEHLDVMKINRQGRNLLVSFKFTF